jgi:hypothetical protein
VDLDDPCAVGDAERGFEPVALRLKRDLRVLGVAHRPAKLGIAAFQPHRLALGVGKGKAQHAVADGEGRRPAERRLLAAFRRQPVEVLARDIGVLHDEARPAGAGEGRHGQVDGDDDAEEGQHDRQHVLAGEFAGLCGTLAHLRHSGASNLAV